MTIEVINKQIMEKEIMGKVISIQLHTNHQLTAVEEMTRQGKNIHEMHSQIPVIVNSMSP